MTASPIVPAAQDVCDELTQQLAAWVQQIPALDGAAMDAARTRQAELTKPAGALGRLETLAVQLAGITAQARPRLTHKAILIAAADHGVCVEDVSAYPQSVTVQMVGNFLRGGAAINVLAQRAQARVTVLDMGVLDMGLAQPDNGSQPAANLGAPIRFVARPVAAGTANLAQGPAMTHAQALQSLHAGVVTLQEELAAGLDVVGLGEMGIGNTTAAAAVACALTGIAPAAMVGPGTGVDAGGLARKVAVVQRGLAVNQLTDCAAAAITVPGDLEIGLRVLSGVGGFELGGLAGAMIAAVAHRVPVVVDGFVATAAAMLAVQLAPGVRDFLIAAHASAEPGHAAMLRRLGLEPYLALDMRLGEGTGAALCMTLVDAAWQTLDQMATFTEAGVAARAAAEKLGS